MFRKAAGVTPPSNDVLMLVEPVKPWVPELPEVPDACSTDGEYRMP